MSDIFFCQAEDGIRDIGVTGVQTCALPICGYADGERLGALGVAALRWHQHVRWRGHAGRSGVGGRLARGFAGGGQNGRGSCWGREEILGVCATLKKKKSRLTLSILATFIPR